MGGKDCKRGAVRVICPFEGVFPFFSLIQLQLRPVEINGKQGGKNHA
jgi:hypothetical protein